MSLVGFGPVPLSACALVSSRVAECATPATMLRCKHLDVHRGSRTAIRDTSCCKVSNAPIPTSQQQKLADPVFLAQSSVQILHVMPEPAVLARALLFEIEINP